MSDLCFNQNAIYTVSESNKGRVFYFDRSIMNGRANSPMGKGMVQRHNADPEPNVNYEIESVRSYPDNTRSSGLPQNEMALMYNQKPRREARNRPFFSEFTVKQVSIPNSKSVGILG